jgi:formylglycine-generating enzyme required for sulfatase activity
MAGDQQRIYPWSESNADERIDTSKAQYSAEETKLTDPSAVGSHGGGHGKYGHDDLAGNLWEWVADSYSPEQIKGGCNGRDASALDATLDCQRLDSDSRVQKGGSFVNPPELLKNDVREWSDPDTRDTTFGFRCVRQPR